MIDLHAHTTASDGTLSFEELVRCAELAGLKALAVTDHDNIRSAARIPGTASRVELIAGVELTVFDDLLGYSDIHMLGLFIDVKNGTLNERLEELEAERERQKMATVARLRELGYSITFDDVKKHAEGAVGRPHIARALMEKHPDEFPSIKSAFAKLLGRGRPGYVGRNSGFGFKEAIDLVHGAGGLAFMAHPLLYPYGTEKLLRDFKAEGGDGAETCYDYIRNAPDSVKTHEENRRILSGHAKLAREIGLLECGGSDFHGENKGQRLGEFWAPDGMLREIKAALRKPL